MRFDPDLESEYIRTRLQKGRTLIRMACLLALATVILRVGEITVGGPPGEAPFARHILVLFPVVVLAVSVLLTWLAWAPSFPRNYAKLVNYLVPARNIFVASAIAIVASRGQVELLMILPTMVLSVFFFLGLHFRPALVTVVLTIAAFAIAGLTYQLATGVLLRSSAFLVVTASVSAVAAWQIERQSRRSFLEGRLITRLVEHDALTGAKNRRVFDEHLARLWQQAMNEGRRLAILLVDVDHFKAYNDRYGHQAGDATLQRVAHAVQEQLTQPIAMLARYGGEEFAALLYDIDAQDALAVAERMRLAVNDLAIEHRSSRVCSTVTISIGVAAVQPSAGRAPVGALQLADEALYKAKTGGRNRVHVAAEADYRALQTGVFAQYGGNLPA